MCGIVGIVRKNKELEPANLDELLELLERIELSNAGLLNIDFNLLIRFAKKSISVEGAIFLVKNTDKCDSIQKRANSVRRYLVEILSEEKFTEEERLKLTQANDALWRIEKDACIGASQISELLTSFEDDVSKLNNKTIAVYRSINLVLRSLDRIEVRGRDSAGISIALYGVDVDADLSSEIAKRKDAVFSNGSISHIVKNELDVLYFVYKQAAEIGELGDNVAHLRESIRKDMTLFESVSNNRQVHETVLAHTRWASMGVISEENTHPLDSSESNGSSDVYSLGVLNGDIDNHGALRQECQIPPSITTDAKLIPVLYSRERLQNKSAEPLESFRKVVSRFEGSTAIGILASDQPDKMFLALRGGGQGLYIGIGQDEFFVASEPYGVVEISEEYIRVDGEVPRDIEQGITSRGQIFSLSASEAGTLDGLLKIAYDGIPIDLSQDDVVQSEVTTRDIDRGEYKHYLWKEINEAPRSFSTTLHNKFEVDEKTLRVNISDEVFPEYLQQKIKKGQMSKVVVIGQGTAAVAGQACAHFFKAIQSDLDVQYKLATEVSGFGLKDDMADTLIVAVSQSGTTTDTNRTVDLLKDRGASVISIVNRRGSDLATKSDGVCYTSSGRDVEMSVASTKAFYAQVAAGAYIALAVETLRDSISNTDENLVKLVQSLFTVPEMMTQVLALQEHISQIAKRNVLSRRSWATVGNGPNAIAAREIRIKSSELCYKAIAMDSTEDKKHIDLSSEPLIIVCASGIDGSNADDVAKEIAIYEAHKACPIVITDDDSHRFDSNENVIIIPKIHRDASFILTCVAGHILGYESAKAIDETAILLRQTRGALGEISNEKLSSFGALNYIGEAIDPYAQEFFKALAQKKYDAVLDASDAANLTKLFVAFNPPYTPDLLKENCSGLQTPQALLNCAVSMLTHSIDQLTRPIDAIRHQAKTVTVGISRSDDTLLRSPSVAYLMNNSIERDLLSFPVIRTMLALDEVIENISGHTRYEIHGDVNDNECKISILEQVGSAESLTSRVSQNPILRGSKRLVAREQTVWISQGKSDGRNVILVPEVKRSKTVGITLLHIDIKENDQVDIEARKRMLEGYKQRLFALRDAVTETSDTFDDEVLGRIDLMELLTQPVVYLAKYWA